jgi:SMC interacting uncharacterized protein involved in chromosome segregation
MTEKIPGWIERLLLPKLSSLEGDLKAFRAEVAGEFKAVNGRIDNLEKQMHSLRSEVNGHIDSLEKQMYSLRSQLPTIEIVGLQL